MGRKKLTEEEKIARKEERKAKKKSADAVETSKEDSEEKKTEKIEMTDEEREEKKRKLLEKAKELAEKLGEGEVKTEAIKEKLEAERKTLVPLEEYLKAGVYIGTKVITPHMRQYVFKRRNDGIAIFNVNLVDKKIKDMIKIISKYNPEDFIVVCKRENGWKAVEKFSQLTGVRVFSKKYPAGILTNSKLPNFFETEMIFICDPWIDKNALHDGKKVKKKIYGLCDTNNYTFDIDFFVPCNNKSGKSLGLIFYILTREYLKARGIEKEIPPMEDFMTEDSQE